MARLPRLEHSDADLVLRARGGDRWAAEELFQRHVAAVMATAMRLLGDRAAAEDVVQDSFAIALEKLSALRDPPAFHRWILQIAVSQVHRRFRKERFFRQLGLGTAVGSVADLASPDTSPDVRAELTLLDRELKRLPAEERLCWMLRYVEGMELREVADACGCSLATAKRRIGAADARVRRHVRLEHDDG